MSTTEDRLIAALAARADQVQPEDLRAPEVPVAPAGVIFLRRPAAYAVGIAAAAAAIAGPFLISGLGPDESPTPPATEGASLAPQPDVGGDWPEIDRQRVDLDGDQQPEVVLLRGEPGEPLLGPRLRLESELSTGGAVFGVIDSGDVSANFMRPIDADADGGQEVTLNRDQADGLTTDWVVVDLVDDQLVELEQDTSVPLATGDVPDPADSDLAFAVDRWVADGSLYSARSVRSFPRYGMSFELPDPYVADVWAWRAEDGRLVPEPAGELCISRIQGTRKLCAHDEGDDLPAFFPEATDLIDVGESFSEDVDFDGRDDTISLDGTVNDGMVDAGDVELVVDTTTNGELRWPVPAGWAPQVYASTIQIGMVDGLSVLVSQEGGDSDTLTYVATGPEGFSGELIAVETDGAPFGSGYDEAGLPHQTWVGADGRMYTSVGPPLGGSPSEAASQVYVWTLARGPELTAVDLGTFCFDFGAGPVEVSRCDA